MIDEAGINMEKVLTLSSPPLPKNQLEKLIQTVIQEEGNERMLVASKKGNKMANYQTKRNSFSKFLRIDNF